MRRIFVLAALIAFLTAGAGSALADPVTGLTTFQSGTPAHAASVNDNFSRIVDAVNEMDARLAPTRSLPNGVTTTYRGMVVNPYFHTEIDPNDGVAIIPYVTGPRESCVMKIAFVNRWISGTNSLKVLDLWHYEDLYFYNALPDQYRVENFTKEYTGNFAQGLFSFKLRRVGDDPEDTCGDAELMGIKVIVWKSPESQHFWLNPWDLY